MPRLPALRFPKPATVFYLAVAVLASAPAWIVRHPPLQDLPFHLATLRVIHDYGNPAYGFTEDFYLNLTHTSYILYYLIGSVLSYVLGVYYGHIGLMCLYLGGTPLALRELLRAFGKDERLCLFAVPLVVNVMFIYGLLPYVFGIPIMFLAIAAGARDLEQPTRNRGIWLGVVSLALFFAHVFPFGVFGIAYAVMFPWSRPKAWLRAAIPVAPVLACVVWWVKVSDSGKASAGDLGAAVPAPLDQAFPQFFTWSTDIFTDTTDELWIVLLALVALVSLGLAQGDRDSSRRISRPYVLVVVACVVLYFKLGDHLGDVWLFAQRFPVPALFCAIPLLRMPTGMRGVAATVAILGVGIGSIVNTCQHFIKFERDEVGDIDGAVDAMDPGKKVCGLIFDKGSSIVHHVPFLHFVSYYQAEKGGVAMFTYASFPHWPFRFREGHYPPPGRPARLRWEWTPEQTPMSEIFPYYDYVLVRGQGFNAPPGTYHVKWHGDRWTVWAKDR